MKNESSEKLHKNLKVLVTGSNGFLGANVVRQLLPKGHHVLAAHRKQSDLWRLREVNEKIEFVEMDLQQKESVRDIFQSKRPDAVIHCATYGVKYEEQDRVQSFDVNVHGTSELILAAKSVEVQRFIHVGSCFEYGNKDHIIREDEILEPTGLYGSSKAAASLYALALSKEVQIPLTVIRPFGLWGFMEESHRLVPLIVSHCLDKKPLKLTAGEQIRDYTYVEDAANMLVSLLELPEFPTCEILNLGSGVPVTLKKFVAGIASFFHREDFMLFGQLPYRPTEMWHLVANTEKWVKYVGSIKRTSFVDGLNKFLEYHGK